MYCSYTVAMEIYNPVAMEIYNPVAMEIYILYGWESAPQRLIDQTYADIVM